MKTRRNVLQSAPLATAAVIGVATGQLSTCATAPVTVDPAVIDQINQAIASTCNVAVVVAAQTIAAVVIAAFPVAAGVATIAQTLATQIATYLCALIPPVGGGTPRSTTINGANIVIHGWHIVDGKPVWF